MTTPPPPPSPYLKVWIRHCHCMADRKGEMGKFRTSWGGGGGFTYVPRLTLSPFLLSYVTISRPYSLLEFYPNRASNWDSSNVRECDSQSQDDFCTLKSRRSKNNDDCICGQIYSLVRSKKLRNSSLVRPTPSALIPKAINHAKLLQWS